MISRPMLNDTFEVYTALTAHGIGAAGRHGDIKDMAKGPALRVRLSDSSDLVSLEVLAEAGRGAVWTLRDGQHNGFPGLKTGHGLLALDDAARVVHQKNWAAAGKSAALKRAEVTRLLGAHSFDLTRCRTWPSPGHRQRIRERLHQLGSLADNHLSASITAAFERFLGSLDRSPSPLEQLFEKLRERFQTRGDDWIEVTRDALIGPVPLVIDVVGGEFALDASDPRQVAAITAALNASAKGSGVCALTGQNTELHEGNFPQPNLPGLGQTYLLSCNTADIPALDRYRPVGDRQVRRSERPFPIGAALTQAIGGAIQHLTQDGMKEKTWRLIPSEKSGEQDLLIVSFPPVTDAEIARALSGEDENGDGDEEGRSPESLLEELAGRVIQQTHGKAEHDRPENMTILVLRTVDPANRKTIYHRSASAKEFHTAAVRWPEAVRNNPPWIELLFPKDKKRVTGPRKPPFVKPLSVIRRSQMQFVGDGNRRVPVIGIPASEAFALFLGDGNVLATARAILDLLLKRHAPLLAGLAVAQRAGIDRLSKYDPKTDLRRDGLRTVTWLGILLFMLQRKKEDYMTSAGFRLGQLLAVADVVHIGYCMDVRDGSIPGSLIGNAVLVTAASQPYKALDLLCQRWPPYAAWLANDELISGKAEGAKRMGEKDKAYALYKALGQAQRVKPMLLELPEQLEPYREKTDEVFRAELLLGYMAGLEPKKSEEPGKSEPSPQEGNKP